MAKSTIPAVTIDDKLVLDKFKGLMDVAEGKRARKDMRTAMRQTLSILRTSARKGAKPVVGHLTKLASRGVVLKVSKSGLGGRVQITRAEYYPEYGKGRSGQGKVLGLFWWELGTKSGMGRDHRFHKGTPAKPFFKAAIETKLPEAGNNLAKAIDKIIQKEAQR